jgi:hypothetical protein
VDSTRTAIEADWAVSEREDTETEHATSAEDAILDYPTNASHG